jgi:hypothetical protein
VTAAEAEQSYPAYYARLVEEIGKRDPRKGAWSADDDFLRVKFPDGRFFEIGLWGL